MTMATMLRIADSAAEHLEEALQHLSQRRQLACSSSQRMDVKPECGRTPVAILSSGPFGEVWNRGGAPFV